MNKFISRLNGSEKTKNDYEKVGDFWKPTNISHEEFDKQFKSMLYSFNNDIEIEPDLVFKLLKHTWNYDDDILRKVANYFQSFDYSHLFMNEYDAHNDLDIAWNSFIQRYDMDYQINPFI